MGATVPVNDDLIGATLAGKYLIKRRVGAGGMGAVYEAEHVELGKRVAVKVIEHERAESPELEARFQREARAASAVESEHIVQMFDVGRDPAVGLYMVMEILAGEDLASRLETAGGKLPLDEATAIAVQAARGLAKAHAAGVVHRDLKPANLFLTEREDGTTCVKLLDFGISKLLREEPEPGASSLLTRAGAVLGTPMYMSPEQAQGLPVDARVDVWSLGAVAYQMLAGRPAFEQRDTYEQMIIQVVTTRPPPLAEIAPWVPEAVARVVEHSLVRDIDARLDDAATFATELARAAKMRAPDGSARSFVARERSGGAGASVGESVQPTSAGVVSRALAREQATAARTGRRGRIWIGLAAAAAMTAAISGLVASRGADIEADAAPATADKDAGQRAKSRTKANARPHAPPKVAAESSADTVVPEARDARANTPAEAITDASASAAARVATDAGASVARSAASPADDDDPSPPAPRSTARAAEAGSPHPRE